MRGHRRDLGRQSAHRARGRGPARPAPALGRVPLQQAGRDGGVERAYQLGHLPALLVLTHETRPGRPGHAARMSLRARCLRGACRGGLRAAVPGTATG
jgi:hypothetical protein